MLAVLLPLGLVALPEAASADPCSSFACAVDDSVTSDVSDIGFKLTEVTSDRVSFTYDTASVPLQDDPNAWCEYELFDQHPFIAGFMNGSATGTWATGGATFAKTVDEDGDTVSAVAPGHTYDVVVLCHSGSDLQRYRYTSAWFTVPDVAPPVPDRPTLSKVDGFLFLGATFYVDGEAPVDRTDYRLYRDDKLTKTGKGSSPGAAVFGDLPAGVYTVSVANHNAAGWSGWSAVSAGVTVVAGAAPAPRVGPDRSAPRSISVTVAQHRLRLSWKRPAAGKATRYAVVVRRAGHTKFSHSTKLTHLVTKRLAVGNYVIRISAYLKGKPHVMSFSIRIR